MIGAVFGTGLRMLKENALFHRYWDLSTKIIANEIRTVSKCSQSEMPLKKLNEMYDCFERLLKTKETGKSSEAMIFAVTNAIFTIA